MDIPEIKNNTINIYPNQNQTIIANRKPAESSIIDNAFHIAKEAESSIIDDASHIAKEAAISAIPIYGTIQSFKQGKIGWGIFGIVTDVLTIMPVIGFSARFVGSLIKGSSIAIEAGSAVAKTMKVTDVAIKGSQAAAEANSIIKSSNIGSEIAKSIAIENNPVKYYGKKLVVQIARSVDPGFEPLYKTSKYLYGKGGELGDKLGSKLISNK